MMETPASAFATNETNAIKVESITGTFGSRESEIHQRPRPTLTIKAILHVECTVDISVACAECDSCGAKPPKPDIDDPEVLSFILANHLGERIVFPTDEASEPEKDHYPVRGWVRAPTLTSEANSLLCPDCAKAARDALALRKKLPAT